MAIPAMALLQQHEDRRDILIEPAALGGVRNWGRNRAIKTNRLVVVSVIHVLNGAKQVIAKLMCSVPLVRGKLINASQCCLFFIWLHCV